MSESTKFERSKKITDFTSGSPAKHILKFYWPLLFTSMLQQVYNFVDMMIVGKGLGDHALASVGNMGSLFFFDSRIFLRTCKRFRNHHSTVLRSQGYGQAPSQTCSDNPACGSIIRSAHCF